jgi:AraC-like DNA-binding protein
MFLDPDTFRRLCVARDRLVATGDDTPLRVSEIADEVLISRFHFIRRFQAVFGTTPHRYRTRERIEAAKRMLAVDGLRVTDVCMRLGFSSLGSFSSLFKRTVGLAPEAYRRSVLEKAATTERVHEEVAPGCLSLMGRIAPDAFRNSEEA